MKIKAVILYLNTPVRIGRENGPEWFKDPTRNIKIFRVIDTGIPENFPADDVVWPDDILPFLERQTPPLHEKEVLLVTDRTNIRPEYGHVLRVGHRYFVDTDRIIGEIHLIEHSNER